MSGEILRDQDLVEHAVEVSCAATKIVQLINGRTVGTINEPENGYYVVGRDSRRVHLRRFSEKRNCSETEVIDRSDEPESIFSVPLARWNLGRMMAIVDTAIDLIEDDIRSGEIHDNIVEEAIIIADASIMRKH